MGLIKRAIIGTALIFSLETATACAESLLMSEIISSGSATRSTEFESGIFSLETYLRIGWNYGAGVNFNIGGRELGINAEGYIGNLNGIFPDNYDLGINAYINPSESFNVNISCRRTSRIGNKTPNDSIDISGKISL